MVMLLHHNITSAGAVDREFVNIGWPKEGTGRAEGEPREGPGRAPGGPREGPGSPSEPQRRLGKLREAQAGPTPSYDVRFPKTSRPRAPK